MICCRNLRILAESDIRRDASEACALLGRLGSGSGGSCFGSYHCHNVAPDVLLSAETTMSNGIINMRETKEERTRRLMLTPQGAALANLLTEFGSSVLLAEKIGVTSSVVAAWINLGKISMRGASLLTDKLGRPVESFRPDLTEADWRRAFPGPVPGVPAINRTDDAKLLAKLAYQFGGVTALCRKLDISSTMFHNWKSRGKIPSRRLEQIKELAES